MLSNAWTLAKDFGHLTHGYVSTSHASQGKTVDRTLIAMGSESTGAINSSQFYVSASRGRESARILTDMTAEVLREAIVRSERRKSAVELLGVPKVELKKPDVKKRGWRDRATSVMTTVRTTYQQLRDKAFGANHDRQSQREGFER